MLVDAYPFEDPDEPKDFRKTINVHLYHLHDFVPLSSGFFIKIKFYLLFATQRILSVQYSVPENIQISEECRHLISRIFVGDPAQVSEVLRVISTQK